MNCKDCLYVDVCKDRYGWFSDCDNFKDRSHFAELPCKAGDHLYAIFPSKKLILEYVVMWITIEEACMTLRAVDPNYFTTTIFFARDIGTRYFLTREEAEQALNKVEEL